MADRARILYVSVVDPDPVGNGANHRAYQVWCDLRRAAGAHAVANLSYFGWRRARRDAGHRPAARAEGHAGVAARMVRRGRRLMRGLRHAGERGDDGGVAARYCGDEFIARYREFLAANGQAALCVIEHPAFARLVPLNAARGMPTIACPQNIESFDAAARCADPHAGVRAAAGFGAEYRLLSACDARLFMSSAEAGVCEGLGLAAEVYAYRPPGEVRAACLRIAQRRRDAVHDGPVVVLGSGSHHTTREAMEWFLDNASRHGLPAPVVVVGAGTEALRARGPVRGGIDVLGWVAQEELETLLVRAPAVVVPQRTGFGTLTKLPELVLAGVPVIASRHAARACRDLPGVRGLDDDWPAWTAAIGATAPAQPQAEHGAYLEWESRQDDALVDAVARCLAGAGAHRAPP